MTPTRPDIEYFEWLVSQIDTPSGKTFNELFEVMHNCEFVWTLDAPHDENRVQDGLDLRSEFLASGDKLELEFVTFLEVLVALSRRVAFIAGGEADQWAWKLIKNINLHNKTDPLTLGYPEQVTDRLNTIVWRTYRADGHGGFFPLKHPQQDQTKVELWYQMNAYAIERATN